MMTSQPGLVRYCAACRADSRAVLSFYNDADTCWPCQTKARLRGIDPAPKELVRNRSAADRDIRLDHALDICRTLTPIFSTYQLAKGLGINVHGAAGVLRGLRLRGVVEQHGATVLSGPRIDNRRHQVAMWRLV